MLPRRVLQILPSFSTPDASGGVWSGYADLGAGVGGCPSGAQCGQMVLVFNGPESGALCRASLFF